MTSPGSAVAIEVSGSKPKASNLRSREQKKADGLRTKTIHLKVRPESLSWLDQAAREINMAWNFAREASRRASQPYRRREQWLSAFDLNALTVGCGEVFHHIGSEQVQCVNAEYVTRRQQFKKHALAYRASGGRKRALGWVPFKAANLRVETDPERLHLQKRSTKAPLKPWKTNQRKTSKPRRNEKPAGSEPRALRGADRLTAFGPRCGARLTFCGKTIRLFQMDRFLQHRGEGYVMGAGNFAQNALGEWFLNVAVRLSEPGTHGVPELTIAPHESIGLDPGLTALFTSSRGDVYHANRSYRDLEAKIAQCQRRGHKKQAKRVNRLAVNRRDNHLHQLTRSIVNENQVIKIGDVSCAFLRAGNHAKSALDSCVGKARAQLHAKGRWAGRSVYDVSEKLSTQVCSNCDAKTGPKGLRQLVVRTWTCSVCQTEHDRDVNSAIHIERAKVCAEVSVSVCGNLGVS